MFRALRSISFVAALAAVPAALHAQMQSDHNGRRYHALPDTAHIVVTVEKGFNGKPMPGVAVIFHATRNGSNDGNMELKTDSEGRATMDVIELGSHVTVQVIASGFATHAEEFDLDGPTKEILIKMERPKAQVSNYEENTGRTAEIKPGVQEHVVHKPATGPSGATGSTGTTGSTGATGSTGQK